MNVKLTKNINEANCITHSGTFHADEIFATLILSIIKDEIIVYRTSEVDDKMRETNCIIYDVGRGELDHHQKGGNGTRENGLMYAACGLASIVASFNPRWDEDMSISNDRFIEAMNICRKVLENEILSQVSKLKAKDKVEKAIEESENHILILNEYMPWQDFVLSSNSDKAKDLWYAIYPSKRGGYALHCVNVKQGSFENRKSLPKEWSGLENEKLQEVTGVKDARFCHIACFLATTDTFEAALELAKLAVNN